MGKRVVKIPRPEGWDLDGDRLREDCAKAGLNLGRGFPRVEGGMVVLEIPEGAEAPRLDQGRHGTRLRVAEAKVSASVLQALDAGLATQAQVQGALARLLRKAGLG